MENRFEEEEKYSTIRQTIREVILPLVQAIYVEDPSDILSFCSRYFESLLKDRENNESNTDDPNFKYTGGISHKDEQGGIAKNTNEVLEAANVSPSNLQGSASDPILSTDKLCEGLSLRETSSWEAPNLSHSAGSSAVSVCNLADAMSRIGDQLCPNTEKRESPESDAKTGDSNSRQKEEKISESSNSFENENSSQIIYEPATKEAHYTHELPSAPAEENVDESHEKMPMESMNSKIQQESSCCKKANQDFNIQERKYEDICEALSLDAQPSSTTDQGCARREANKISNKQLSPNSSFGFIPHLTAHKSRDEPKEANSEYKHDLSNDEKANENVEALTKRLSQTLHNLAQEFSSAETNLNEKLENAEEISDVLQGRPKSKETNGNLKTTQDSGKNNEATNGRKKSSENLNCSKSVFKELKDENELANRTNGPICTPKKSPENFPKISPDFKKADDPRSTCFPEDKSSPQQGAVRDPSKPEDSENQNLLQDDRKDSSGSNGQESFQAVDESWRERWYESHPRLDNLRGLPQNSPRFFQGHSIFNTYRRNALHNIGEGGDVPFHRFYTAEDAARGSLDSSPVIRSSVVENNSYASFSADEINRRVNTGRATRNSSDKEIKNTSTPQISSQNIPYSWRKMCKPQASSLENNGKKFNQPQLESGEEIRNSENDNKGELNANKRASHEPETLSEVVIVKNAVNESSTKVENNEEVTESFQQLENYGYGVNVTRSNQRMNFGNLNIGETHIKSCSSEVDKPINIDNGSCSRDCLHSDPTCDHPSDRRHKQTNNKSMKEEVETIGCEDSPVTNIDIESQRNESSDKVEPGLNSAGGDFVSREENENNEQPAGEVIEDNSANNQTPNGPVQAGVLDEIMEGVTEYEEASDNFDGLDFFSNSGSDDRSSEYSETEEFSLDSSV